MVEQENLRENIIAGIKEIYDPEIPINVYDLGFIYGIDIDGSKVHILMTLTVPGCPMHHILTKAIKERISQVDGVDDVEVELTFDPRWSVKNISEEGKKELRKLGYNL